MKNTIKIIAIVFALLIGSSAWADIFTPSLHRGNADHANCAVLNTGSTTANDVRIEIRDSSGQWQEATTIDIPAREVKSISDLTPSLLVYCRVSGISATKARVALCIRDDNFTSIQCVTAP